MRALLIVGRGLQWLADTEMQNEGTAHPKGLCKANRCQELPETPQDYESVRSLQALRAIHRNKGLAGAWPPAITIVSPRNPHHGHDKPLLTATRQTPQATCTLQHATGPSRVTRAAPDRRGNNPPGERWLVPTPDSSRALAGGSLTLPE